MKDPIAIGLFGFAVPLFILGAMFYGSVPMAGMGSELAICFSFGAAAMFVGGFLTFQMPNSYVASVFFTYGAFFLAFGITGADGTLAMTMKSSPQLLSVWFSLMAVITVIFLLAALRLNVALVIMFAVLAAAFVLFVAGNVKMAALLFMVDSVIGFYLGAVHIINPVMGRALLPVGSLARKPA